MVEIPEEELRKYVRDFLNDFKALISENRFEIKPNAKDKGPLTALGLTRKQREEILLGLEVSDYCSGPTKDKLHPGDYWEFGRQIDGIDVYIKIKIADPYGKEFALCMSFHKAEYPLKYHFK